VSAHRNLRRPGAGPRAGSIMLHAIAGLLLLMFLAVTLLMISRSMVGHSVRRSRELRALAAAEAACSRGMAMLESGAITTVPYKEANVPIGRQKMDVEVVAAETGVTSPYSVAKYEIRGTGYAGKIKRTIALGGSHDSFLSYSRFLESGTLSYAAGATLSGQVYCGGDMSLSGRPVTFKDNVEVKGKIQNKTYGVYEKSVTENVPAVQLSGSMDPATFRNLAKAAGLYYSSTSTTPVIDLSLFDFDVSPPVYGSTKLPSNFNGVVFGEGDVAVKGLLEGRSLTIAANKNIIINGNIRTGCSRKSAALASPSLAFNAASGTELVSSVSLTPLLSTPSDCATISISGSKWKRVTTYLYEDSHLLGVETVERPPTDTGKAIAEAAVLSDVKMNPATHSYRAEVHYWSDGSGQTKVDVGVAAGDPVNVALLATNTVNISQYAWRVLRIDAALFARDGSWQAPSSGSSQWACTGVYDLDEDGVIETNNQDGWNESAVNSNTWMLTINGPIITKTGGSAGEWSNQATATGKGTRHYNYDDDIVYFQPPNFPVMLSRWALLYWREA